jgi:hypothetical protein
MKTFRAIFSSIDKVLSRFVPESNSRSRSIIQTSTVEAGSSLRSGKPTFKEFLLRVG